MSVSVTWSDNYGMVQTGNMNFPLGSRPTLDFEFDSVYYEPDLGNKFKVINNVRTPLTESEISECSHFGTFFLEVADYPVQAVEKETNLWRGTMLKSEAQERGYNWVLGQVPDYPVARLIAGDNWEKIVAIIMDDGWYKLEPDGVCDKCVLFMNQQEWNAFPHPTTGTQKWNFQLEKWEDYRTLEHAKNSLDQFLRNSYTTKRMKIVGNAPAQEMASWPIQLSEAQAWTVDNTVSTPFIDGMVASLKGAKSKEDIVADILKHNEDSTLKKQGELHGEMYGYILRGRAASTLDEVDAIEKEAAEHLGTSPYTRPLSGI